MKNTRSLRRLLPAALLAACVVLLSKQGDAANSFYNASGAPAQGSALSSTVMRTEFANIGAGFDKMPELSGFNGTAIVVNGGGTGLTNTVGALALAGNFTTTGAFNTTFVQQASTSLTLPSANDTLVGRASTDTLTNKTFDTASTGSVFKINGTQVSAVTGNGAAVLASSPTLTTPNLRTPSAVTLTNATGCPVASCISGLGTGVATLLGGTSSGTGGPAGTASPTFTGTVSMAALAASGNGVISGTAAVHTTLGGWTGQANFESLAGSSAPGSAISAYQNGTGSAYLARVDGTSTNLFTFNFGGSVTVGSITTNGTTTAYNTSSDRRLKNNIVDAGDAGAIIDGLRVRSWDWKSNGAHEDFGFVAQEENTVAPFAVTAGDNDPNVITKQWGRDDSKLVPLLVKEIQSLRVRVATLEAKVH